MHRIAPNDMVWLPGGTFLMGSDQHDAEEAPAHKVSIDSFFMDVRPVTNAQFRRFVSATGYVTLAELAPSSRTSPDTLPGVPRPGSLVFRPPTGSADTDEPLSWCDFCVGADWKHPTGPRSSIEGMDDQPVVHVAYADVQAYARWAGKDIPTEAEWEFTAAGAWNDRPQENGTTTAGPFENCTKAGGTTASSAADCPPDTFGVPDMITGVWEWTSDFWASRHDRRKAFCIPRNPRSINAVDSCLPPGSGGLIPRRVLKGGPRLCGPDCFRAWASARRPHPVDSPASHIGFRCALRPSMASGSRQDPTTRSRSQDTPRN